MQDARDNGRTCADTPSFTLPPMPPLPSVHDLVQRIAIVMSVIDDGPGSVEEWGLSQEAPLIDLVTTMPAVTLADAAAQLWLAFRIVDNVGDECPGDRRHLPPEQLTRLIRSVLPVVCDAAGVDLVAWGNGAPELCARAFPERGCQSDRGASA